MGRTTQGRKVAKPVSARRLAGLVTKFPKQRVLVIGDFMLDEFIWGDVNRISPEAPVPIVRMTREDSRAGGAGNVVANVRALGSAADSCGTVGQDAGAKELLRLLRERGAGVAGMVPIRGGVTTRKMRIVAHQQQVVRLDRESSRNEDERAVKQVVRYALDHLDRYAAVIVSDYGKGVVGRQLLEALAERQARKRFLWLIDPKRPNFGSYRGASLVKPNVDEASAASGVEIKDLRSLCDAGQRLLDAWQAESVLISRGEGGMSLFKRSAPPRHFPTAAREVFDVTGAGDTVIAACALTLAAGGSLEEATVLANIAAGVAVAHVGTVPVSARALREAIQRARGDGLCGA